MPLVHPPGHGQADFGEAVAVLGGEERRIHFLCVDLPHSDACFVKAFPAETAEAFCDGHDAAFAFFGGVPRSMLYDNTRLAVARILSDGTRRRTRAFAKLQVGRGVPPRRPDAAARAARSGSFGTSRRYRRSSQCPWNRMTTAIKPEASDGARQLRRPRSA